MWELHIVVSGRTVFQIVRYRVYVYLRTCRKMCYSCVLNTQVSLKILLLCLTIELNIVHLQDRRQSDTLVMH